MKTQTIKNTSIKFNEIANKMLGEEDYCNLKKIILKLMNQEKDKYKRQNIIYSFMKIVRDAYFSSMSN